MGGRAPNTVHGAECFVGLIHRKTSSVERYAGRGIGICRGWRESYTSFLSDMGRKPSPELTLDRTDNDDGYHCGHCDECTANGWVFNCRWATMKEQINNRECGKRPVVLVSA